MPIGTERQIPIGKLKPTYLAAIESSIPIIVGNAGGALDSLEYVAEKTRSHVSY
jgi:hypothetical protein